MLSSVSLLINLEKLLIVIENRKPYIQLKIIFKKKRKKQLKVQSHSSKEKDSTNVDFARSFQAKLGT